MDEKSILTKVISILKSSPIEATDNFCPKLYEGGTRGGCFASFNEDSEVASHFYSAMLKEKFLVDQPLRQDYLTWRGILSTPNKSKVVIFNVRTLIDTEKDDILLYELLKKGYKTYIYIDISENK